MKTYIRLKQHKTSTPKQNSYNHNRKVQVGNDQEKAQSEKDSHSKNRDGKKKPN